MVKPEVKINRLLLMIARNIGVWSLSVKPGVLDAVVMDRTSLKTALLAAYEAGRQSKVEATAAEISSVTEFEEMESVREQAQ